MPSKALVEFAARCLLQEGFIDQPLPDLGGMTESEQSTVKACWENPYMREPLEEFWRGYEAEREVGAVPAVAEPWYD